MNNKFRILISYWFVIALMLLLLNDFLLKELYGNWLTGKISDISGLFVFPLFWTALFPKHKKHIFWLTGILFIFWKSSYSQNFIDTWNTITPLSISRIVDYTDLIAIFILPFAFKYENEKIKTIKVSPYIPFVLVSFSFMATSYSTDIKVEKEYSFNFGKNTLKKKIYNLPSIFTPDYLNENLYKIDSTGQFKIHQYYGDTISLDQNPVDLFVNDTMSIYINEDFCSDGYEALINISGNAHKSKIKLVGFHHSCPEDEGTKNDKEILMKSFQNKIIDELNK